jgi:phage terminase large subunit-like protein
MPTRSRRIKKRSRVSSASSRRSAFSHRVDKYAADVVGKRIVAGPWVRLACERHLRDRRNAEQLGFVFDVAAADHAIEFFENFLRLPDTADDNGDPKPFVLQPWQTFIVGSLFGWKWKVSGHRRFRNAYVEIGKGNGKTPLCAGIGLYGLVMDGERAPEIYAAATDRDQAQIMFRDAVRMVDSSPALTGRITKSGVQTVHNLSFGMGFFRPFSREQGVKSGTRPHMGLIDELHEHPSPEIVNKMRAGAKGNVNALFVEITNSGYDRTSVCFQHHEHSKRIVQQAVKDERWFAYVCALDDGDDPLEDRSCWPKANPNQGVSIGVEYLEDQVAAAKNIPAETNTVLRLNFCVWTQALTRFFDMPKWLACGAHVPDEELVGAICLGALDLGQSDDLSAFAKIWLLDDGRIVARMRYWLPRSAVEKFKSRPYAEWERSGLLEITEGDVTDYDVVEDAVLNDCLKWGVRELAYDKRFAGQMALHLEGGGVTCVDTPQGFQLNEALRQFSDWVVTGLFCHGADPILTWMASNTVVRHGRNKEIRLDKDKSSEKIDGIAALTMAADRVIRTPADADAGATAYDDDGIFVL